jgi:histidine triad (HIT) family protein
MTEEACTFCQIVAGTLPSMRVAENAEAVAFMDIEPANDGHCLVIPKRHFVDIFAIPPKSWSAVAIMARTVSRAVRAALGADDISIVQANGRIAGQTQFHLHIHVLPRRADDRLFLNWRTEPMRPYRDIARIPEIAELIRKRIAASA